MPDFTAAFTELRQVLASHAAQLDVKKDNDTELYLDTRHIQKNKKPLFFGAVQLKKSHVAFHLMPVYVAPQLLASLSPELRARMHGKSCFNFKSVEPALIRELSSLTRAGYDSYKAQGFVP